MSPAGRSLSMKARSATRMLALPVGFRDIRLGVPVDLMLAAAEWRVVGFEIRCWDEASRFLAWGAATVEADRIAAGSALALLDDVDFYRTRTRSFRSLLGSSVEAGATLRDLALDADGAVIGLVVEQDGELRRLRPDRPPAAARR
jgi:hypothetical protein